MFGVEPEALGQLGRRQPPGRAGELLVHRIARLVAEGLQDGKQVHPLDGIWRSGIFSRSSLVLLPVDSAAPPSPDDVLRALAGVLDPELRASIVDLGMVHDVKVAPTGDVMVKVALDDRGLPVARADRQ